MNTVFLWIIPILWIFLFLWALRVILQKGTFIYKKPYWITFSICFIISILATIFSETWLDPIISRIIVFVGLLGMAITYFIFFKQKQNKTIIDYIKLCWLDLFIIGEMYNSIRSIPGDRIIKLHNSLISNLIGIILTILLLIIIILLRYKRKRDLQQTAAHNIV